jgi:hypothetical protein
MLGGPFESVSELVIASRKTALNKVSKIFKKTVGKQRKYVKSPEQVKQA